MFKLSINKVNVSVYMLESSFNLWHVHLSHVNFQSIKYMPKYGLISSVNNKYEKCEICIQAKMTKKSFSNEWKNSRIT